MITSIMKRDGRVVLYDAGCRGAENYLSLANEVVEKNNKK